MPVHAIALHVPTDPVIVVVVNVVLFNVHECVCTSINMDFKNRCLLSYM